MAGRKLAIGLMAVAFVAIGATGCGSGSEANGDGSHPDYAKALAGAPAPLAALYKQANEILPGGKEAYEERLDSLAEYPVVVNTWASWCGPCRYEFPALQDLSAAYGKRVAFFGVDSEDSTSEAEEFLREEPLPYPSYSDPDAEIANEFGAVGLPVTAFYDRNGELVFVQQKPYTEHSELRADIERYALGEGG
jgi:cytochrome c biogenesis protein CcmG/thiol:disulfide interchange protein DsbE